MPCALLALLTGAAVAAAASSCGEAAPVAAEDAGWDAAASADGDPSDGPPSDAASWDIPPEAFAPDALGAFVALNASPGVPSLEGVRQTVFETPDTPGRMGAGTGATFVDLDRDGTLEIVMYSEQFSVEPVVLSYDGERAELRRFRLGEMRRRRWLPVVPGAVADFDGDGFDDLLQNNSVPKVAWGGADGFEVDWSSETGGPVFAVLPADVNQDGLLDMVIASASSNIGGTYSGSGLGVAVNAGERHFEGRSYWFRGTRADSYAVLPVPFAAGEALMLTAMTDNPRPDSLGIYRMAGLSDTCEPTFGDVRPRGLEDYEMHQPMGYALGNLGGDMDVLVIAEDPKHTLLRVHDDGFFEDISRHWGARLVPGHYSDEAQIPWGVALVDFDQDGRADFAAAHGDDDFPFGPEVPGWVGPQRVTLHRNLGDLRFVDVSEEVGLVDEGHFRALATSDIDRDGDADLIVGGIGITPRIYRNDLRERGHGLSIALRGTASNPEGLGSRVEVEVEGLEPQVLYMTSGGTPNASPEPLVYAGLGEQTRAERVTVRWPTGLAESYEDIAGGQLVTLEETAPFEVLPSGRRLPADGRSTATIRVRAGEQRHVELLCPVGRLSGPRVAADGASVWTLHAPRRESISVLRITIDGTPLRVQPRIFWRNDED